MGDDEKSKEQRLMEEVQSLRHEIEQLKSLEGKYRSIFENAVEGIFQSTPSGRFVAANPALARLLGYASPEELIAERTDIEKQQYGEPRRRREFQHSGDENGLIRESESPSLRARVVGRSGAAGCTMLKTRAMASFASTCTNHLPRLTCASR